MPTLVELLDLDPATARQLGRQLLDAGRTTGTNPAQPCTPNSAATAPTPPGSQPRLAPGSSAPAATPATT